ncbi:unnamed protein product [Larinioides sclopetarius]|uniref:Uncharacterized protein n=1 Tax=Larinioides sclopetarius TaxID=280406 RepID=A0AAV1Z2T6_9ARAC
MKIKRKIFAKFFYSNRSNGEPLLDEQEVRVASSVFDLAWNEIYPYQANSDYESDDCDDEFSYSEICEEKFEATMIKVERIAECIKRASEARCNFLKNFDQVALHCKKTIQDLKDFAVLMETGALLVAVSTVPSISPQSQDQDLKMCTQQLQSVGPLPSTSAEVRFSSPEPKAQTMSQIAVSTVPSISSQDLTVCTQQPQSVDTLHSATSPLTPVGLLSTPELGFSIPWPEAPTMSSNNKVRLLLNWLKRNFVGHKDEAWDGISSKNKSVLLRKRLEEVMTSMREKKEIFADLTDWFLCCEELENATNSLMNGRVLNELCEILQKFSEEVTDRMDMSEGEFTTLYHKVLEHCIRQMKKDGKVAKEYSKELLPAIMTFIVVCLLTDHNRSALGCSLINQRMSLDIMRVLNYRALSDQLIDGLANKGIANTIAKIAVAEALVWFANVICLLKGVQTNINPDLPSNTEDLKKIKEEAEKFDKVFSYIEKAYNETKTYNSQTNATHWKAFLVRQAPVDAGHADLEMALSTYLPEDCFGRIKILRIPTEESNWLVKVQASYSLELSRQTNIDIKGEKCTIIQ